MRGSLVVVTGTGEVHIGNNEIANCPDTGCRLSDLVAVPADVKRWCVDEPGMPASEMSAESLKQILVQSRKKGGVKLALPGAQSPLVRSPARLFPCPS